MNELHKRRLHARRRSHTTFKNLIQKLACPAASATVLLGLAVSGFVGASHAAAVTWQVQSDYFGERDAIGQPRSIRGMALSRDGASVYTGLVQSTNEGTTSLRKVKATVLATPGTDHVIFGNGMPGATPGFGQVGGQPVYAGGGTGAFEAWRDVGNSPEAIDTDDRGNVYVALSSAISPANNISIYTSDLSAQVGQISLPSPTGVAVHKSGATYYAYTLSANGLQRWNVTAVFVPMLDMTWTPAVSGAGNLAVDADGTVFVAGGNLVRRVAANGLTVTHVISIPNAADVAVFLDKIYVIKRQSPTQGIIMLNKADLSVGSPSLLVPAFGGTRGDLSQFTSIDIGTNGRIYVSEENYAGAASGSNSGALTTYTPPITSFNPAPGPITGRIYFDRVLISSTFLGLVPPVVTCPGNQTVNNVPGTCSANLNPGTATALDDLDGPVATTGTRSDAQPLNAPYPGGITTITWSATDSSGNSSSCVQTITVNDTQSPVITCPANIVRSNDPGQCTATVLPGAATATDNCGPPAIAGTRSDGLPLNAPYPGGVTTIHWVATDLSGNISSCNQTITVIDDQPPSILCPANVVQSTALGQCSAVVAYPAPAVSDNCPGVGVPICAPSSGSTFPQGTSVVQCSVKDAANITTTCSFTVTVNDTQAPSVACPGDLFVAASGPSGAGVNFSATATDNCGPVAPVCVPPSGSTFPVGTTTVACTATDGSANSDSCSFTVTVSMSGQGPRSFKTEVRNDLIALLATISNNSDRMKLQEAIDSLDKSITADKWLDDSHPTPGSKGEAVFNEEKGAVNDLKALRNNNNSGIPAATFQGYINRLLAVDRQLAVIAINEAIARNGNAGKINNAQTDLNSGDADAAADKPDKAIDDYRNSWKDAISA